MKKLYGFMPIITGICFGSAGIFVRKLSGDMNNTTIVASRLSVAVLLLGIWLAYSHPEYFKIRLKDCWIFIGAGLLGSLGVNVCYNFAINELVAVTRSGAACTFSDCGHDCCIFPLS